MKERAKKKVIKRARKRKSEKYVNEKYVANFFFSSILSFSLCA